jgi:hypothetical protein
VAKDISRSLGKRIAAEWYEVDRTR